MTDPTPASADRARIAPDDHGAAASPPSVLLLLVALLLATWVTTASASALPVEPPASPTVYDALALSSPADGELLAWPPEAWKIRRASRRAQRKAYRVTRRSAGKTMGARRARAGKRRRAERRGFLGVGKLKAKARKTRRERYSRRPH